MSMSETSKKPIVNRCIGILQENSIIAAVLLYVAIALLCIPNFAAANNLNSLVVQISDIVIAACGMTFVMLNGSIDFSVIAIMNLSSAVGALIMSRTDGYLANAPYGYLAAIVAMIAIGAVVGTINGLAVTKLKMPSFIATMTTMLMFNGLALVVTQSRSIGNLPAEFLYLGSGKLFGVVPMPVLIALIVVIICIYILKYTTFGRKIYATGSNPTASFVSGIEVKKCVFSLFVICGVLSGVASVVLTARTAAGVPYIAKNSLLDIVAAVMIGGMHPQGGKGTVEGTMLGALMIAAINNSLNFTGLDYYWITAIKGALVLLVAIDAAVRTRNDR